MSISLMSSTSACASFATRSRNPIKPGRGNGWVRLVLLPLLFLALLPVPLLESESRASQSAGEVVRQGSSETQVFFFPQIGKGGNFNTTFYFHNTGEDTQIQLSLFRSNGTAFSTNLSGFGTNSEFTIPLARGQSISTSTSSSGEVVIGYARVEAGLGVGGTATFRFVEAGSGRRLFEAGVPSSSLLQDFSLLVDSTGTRQTGLALAYPNGVAGSGVGTNSIQLQLYDEDFQLLQQSNLNLAAGEQSAFFVDSLLDMAAGRLASLVVHAEQPVAAVTLRQTFIEESPGRFLLPLATFPVIPGAADTPASSAAGVSQSTFFVPQVGDGQVVGSLRFQTTFAFLNAGPAGQVEMALRDSDGDPLTLDLGELGTGSNFSFGLGQGEYLSVRTPGTGQIKIGYAEVRAPASVGGTAVFTRSTGDGSRVIYEAGVATVKTHGDFSVVVESAGIRDTGLALVRPGAAAPAGAAKIGELRLFDANFNPVGTIDLNLAPGEHFARFVSQLFAGLPGNFFGSLLVVSEVPLSAISLLQTDDPQLEYPDEIANLTTFPVLPGRADQVGSANLSIVKNATANQIGVGGQANYSLQITNHGPDPAQDVVVTDPLPPGTQFIFASGSGWECRLLETSVRCTRPTLNSPGVSAINLSLQGPNQIGSLTNMATVSSATFDPETDNNTASSTIAVEAVVDLDVTIAGESSVFNGDGSTEYTVTVTNSGQSTANNVTFSDTFKLCTTQTSSPENCTELTGVSLLEVTAATVTGNGRSCSHATSSVSCNLASLSPGSSVDVKVTLEFDAQTLGRSILQSASATSSGSEQNAADNQDQFITKVFPTDVQIDLSVTATDSPDPVAPGGIIRYDITVSNAGPGLATNSYLAVEWSPILNLVNSSVGYCKNLGGVVRCDIDRLASGASRQITIRLSVPPGAAGMNVTNKIEIFKSASEVDTNTSNNGPLFITTAVSN